MFSWFNSLACWGESAPYAAPWWIQPVLFMTTWGLERPLRTRPVMQTSQVRQQTDHRAKRGDTEKCRLHPSRIKSGGLRIFLANGGKTNTSCIYTGSLDKAPAPGFSQGQLQQFRVKQQMEDIYVLFPLYNSACQINKI